MKHVTWAGGEQWLLTEFLQPLLLLSLLLSKEKGHMPTAEARLPERSPKRLGKGLQSAFTHETALATKTSCFNFANQRLHCLTISVTLPTTQREQPRPYAFFQSTSCSSTLENEIPFAFAVLQIHVFSYKYSCHPFCAVCLHCPSKKICNYFLKGLREISLWVHLVPLQHAIPVQT